MLGRYKMIEIILMVVLAAYILTGCAIESRDSQSEEYTTEAMIRSKNEVENTIKETPKITEKEPVNDNAEADASLVTQKVVKDPVAEGKIVRNCLDWAVFCYESTGDLMQDIEIELKMKETIPQQCDLLYCELYEGIIQIVAIEPLYWPTVEKAYDLRITKLEAKRDEEAKEMQAQKDLAMEAEERDRLIWICKSISVICFKSSGDPQKDKEIAQTKAEQANEEAIMAHTYKIPGKAKPGSGVAVPLKYWESVQPSLTERNIVLEGALQSKKTYDFVHDN
ncbi:MAG: hypothetical protein WDZ91_03645 [Paenibacillaceae bacterium]